MSKEDANAQLTFEGEEWNGRVWLQWKSAMEEYSRTLDECRERELQWK